MAKIDTTKARGQLTPRREPYWVKLEKFCYLGFRKTEDGPGSWVARIQDEATRAKKYKALGEFGSLDASARYDAAKKAAEEWIGHLAAGGTSEVITVADAARNYIAEQERLGRDGAARDYRRRFNQWLFNDPALADTSLSKLKIGQIKKWRDALVSAPAKHQNPKVKSKRPKAATTINRHIAVFRAALNAAKRDGYVTTAVWDNVLTALPPDTTSAVRKVYLDATQRRALIDQSGGDLGAFLMGLCLLPVRPGALAQLTVADLDRRNKTLTVRTDKAGAGRSIPLPATTFTFFSEHCKNKLPSAWIFTRADGQHWHKDNWKHPIAAAANAAGLPTNVTAYCLRHSTITDLIGAGLDVLQVAKLAGTSVMMIEKHYGHLRADAAVAALSKLAI